eukprot:1153322-Pelagomonas_calceolata.AAC.2
MFILQAPSSSAIKSAVLTEAKKQGIEPQMRARRSHTVSQVCVAACPLCCLGWVGLLGCAYTSITLMCSAGKIP